MKTDCLSWVILLQEIELEIIETINKVVICLMLNQDINQINYTNEISRQIECMLCTIYINLTDRHDKPSLNSWGTNVNQYTSLKLLY